MFFRSPKMDFKNELFHKENQFTPKIEPIDVDFIKKERIDEEGCFAIPGIVHTLKVSKEESFENKVKNCSTPNVWIMFFVVG